MSIDTTDRLMIYGMWISMGYMITVNVYHLLRISLSPAVTAAILSGSIITTIYLVTWIIGAHYRVMEIRKTQMYIDSFKHKAETEEE